MSLENMSIAIIDEACDRAKEFNLDEHFINILEEELRKRIFYNNIAS